MNIKEIKSVDCVPFLEIYTGIQHGSDSTSIPQGMLSSYHVMVAGTKLGL